MGAYINPPDMSKEDFLLAHGKPIQMTDITLAGFFGADGNAKGDDRIVCLIDNGEFSAAGIAFDANELEAFTYPGDRRDKSFFLVPKAKLLGVSNLHQYERVIA